MGTWTKPVVVGYESSRESEFALQWAAEVAQRRGVALHVVHATGVERPSVELARAGILEMYQRRAQEIADEGAARARTMAAPVQVSAIGVQSGAAAALVGQSAQAALVVVGHRGRGALAQALLGSVAFTVATYAACPVAVVGHAPAPLPSLDYPIVVGVDGSEQSTRALDEAAFLADDTRSFLRIVVAWQRPEPSMWSSFLARRAEPPVAASDSTATQGEAFPPAWQSSGMPAGVYDQLVDDLARRAEETARWATERVQQRHPGLRIESLVREQDAAQAILAAAAGASMIVVGARGHGDLKALLLGSVSRRVMQQAECAVHVIR